MKKLLFSGDSAGGGILFSLMNRLITENKKLPDAIVSIYPSTNISENPSPARMISMIDPVLNYKVLKMLNKAYVPEDVNQYDHHISPCFAPNEYFDQYPKTFISVGSLDPLLDDSLYIAKRLKEKVQLNIYDGISHAYMHLVNLIKITV